VLTQRLLAFSRQQALQSKTIDPNRLVHRTMDMLRRTLGEQITINTTPHLTRAGFMPTRRIRKDGTRFWANVVIDAICNHH
jgi:hypothetical protein